MNIEELLTVLRGMCDKAGGQGAWAASAGLSAAYVSDVLNRRRDPGDGLLKAMGVVKVIDYKRDAKLETRMKQVNEDSKITGARQ